MREPEGPLGETASPHVVSCVQLDRAGGHHHVHGLRTAARDGAERGWTLVEAIAAYRDGERFVVDGRELGPTVCPSCQLATLDVDRGNEATALPLCG